MSSHEAPGVSALATRCSEGASTVPPPAHKESGPSRIRTYSGQGAIHDEVVWFERASGKLG